MGNKVVSIKVSLNFFEQVFEPGRRKLQNRLGMKVTQPKFTEFLFKNKIKLEKRDNKFLNRKQLRRKRL